MSIVPRSGSFRNATRDFDVLIVEDSWNVAQSLKSLVERTGARALGPVPTVREALQIVGVGPVSLALVDMNLRDGFADPLVDELIARRIPYAIITAYEALPTDADRGALVRMTKPLDHHSITTLIRNFKELRRDRSHG